MGERDPGAGALALSFRVLLALQRVLTLLSLADRRAFAGEIRRLLRDAEAVP